MKLGFFGLLTLLLVGICTCVTSASLVEEILQSVKNIETLMEESCRPNLRCPSMRSRSKKIFAGTQPYESNNHLMMKSFPQQGFSVDRVKYIDQNILRLQKMKAQLEGAELKRVTQNQPGSVKELSRSIVPNISGSKEKPKVLSANKNTNVNTNVNSNSVLTTKNAAVKPPPILLPKINPGILTTPAAAKSKIKDEKKVSKNVNANTNTNVNTVNRLLNYDLYDI